MDPGTSRYSGNWHEILLTHDSNVRCEAEAEGKLKGCAEQGQWDPPGSDLQPPLPHKWDLRTLTLLLKPWVPTYTQYQAGPSQAMLRENLGQKQPLSVRCAK